MLSELAATVTAAEVQAADGPTRTMIARVDRQRVPPAKVAEEPYRMLIRAPSVVRRATRRHIRGY